MPRQLEESQIVEDNPAIALFLVLGIMIIASRIGGTLARRFRQPRVLGELIVGILLGPTLLDLLHLNLFDLKQAELSETTHQLAELGVLLLMFKVGLDVHLKELAIVGNVATVAGLVGAILPVLMTLPLAMAFGEKWQVALLAGVVLSATSVSISAQVLLEIGVLRTKEGNALLAAALVDDIVAILLVSLAIPLTSGGQIHAVELAEIVLRMVLYLVGALVVAWFGIARLINWLNQWPDIKASYGIPAIALVLALFFGWSAAYLGGVASITGAFIAGLGLSRAQESVKHQIDVATTNIAYAFLVPVFFISVGLQTDLSAFPLSALPFAILLLIVAVASKVLGCGIGANRTGFTRQESLRLGVCMVSRGEVGLIIASLGLSSGVFIADDPLFASLFLVIILTTVMTPPLVRRSFHESTPVREVNRKYVQTGSSDYRPD
ncbi:MAG: cation:proton antiporter [Anaerolineae bacterium]|nr:cation:proton antiporter [Anaerolineae bacterium]